MSTGRQSIPSSTKPTSGCRTNCPTRTETDISYPSSDWWKTTNTSSGCSPHCSARWPSDSEKLDQVASLLQEKYYTEFSSLLPGVSAEEFKDEFIRQYTDNERLRQLLNEKIEEFGPRLSDGARSQPPALTYSVDRIDLSDDVIDMLVKTSTEKRSPNPRIRSTWPETIDNRLPVSITASPVFTPTEVSFTAQIEANRDGNAMPETRLFAEDLQTIVRGLTIEIAVNIDKYYPARVSTAERQGDEQTQPQLTINLHLIKRGALKFDI